MWFGGLSPVEHRPANVVSEPLVVQNEPADRLRQLFALPPALAPSSALPFTLRGGRTRGLDGVGRRTELVCSDMRDRRRLTGRVCGRPGGPAQIPGGPVRVAGRGARLGHRDLAAHPCPSLLDRPTWPRVGRPRRLEEV